MQEALREQIRKAVNAGRFEYLHPDPEKPEAGEPKPFAALKKLEANNVDDICQQIPELAKEAAANNLLVVPILALYDGIDFETPPAKDPLKKNNPPACLPPSCLKEDGIAEAVYEQCFAKGLQPVVATHQCLVADGMPEKYLPKAGAFLVIPLSLFGVTKAKHPEACKCRTGTGA